MLAYKPYQVLQRRLSEALSALPLLAIVMLAGSPPARGASGSFLLPPALDLSANPPWGNTIDRTYYDEGAWAASLGTTGASVAATIPLPSAFSGTLAVWFRATSRSDPAASGLAILTAASSTKSVTFPSGVWTAVHLDTDNTTSFTIAFQRTAEPGVRQDYHLNGFYVTTNTYEAPVNTPLFSNSTDLFLDFTPATTIDLGLPLKGNLLPNSSFELGFAYGWTFSRATAQGLSTWASDAIDTAVKYSGQASIKISDTGARYRLSSPVMRVRPGAGKRKYTLSWYALGNGPTLLAEVGHTVPPPPNFPTNELYSFNLGRVPSQWTRYSRELFLSSRPTPEIYVDFFHVGTGASAVWIDAVQLEEGDLTDYAPREPVELAIQTGRAGNVFFTDEPPQVSVITTSTLSAPADRTLYYEVYDWMNRRVADVSRAITAPPGRTEVPLQLPAVPSGANRIVAWLSENTSQPDELVFSVVPRPPTSGLATNGSIGTHSLFVRSFADTNRQWGLSWTRSLSTSRIFRWAKIEPSQGQFNWADSDYEVAQVSGAMIPLASLHEIPMPDWALTNGFPRLNLWSNYIYSVVNRYKSSIRYWEDHNEPAFHWTEAQFASLLETTAQAVKRADPAAFFVAFGGGGGAATYDASWYSNVWVRLTPSAQSKIDAISVHLYPTGGSGRWMNTDQDARYQSWVNFGKAIGKPIWNTESGTWSMGVKKTDVIGWTASGVYANPHRREETFRRGNWQTVSQTVRSALRSLGNGFDKYFYYDGRLAWYNYRQLNTQPTFLDCDESMRPDGAALLWAQSFVGSPASTARLTNSASPRVEAYFFEFATRAVLAIWNQDPTNRVWHLDLPGAAVFDSMGNLVSAPPVRVTRSAHYVTVPASRALDLRSALVEGRIDGVRDSQPPALSIDSSPRGQQTYMGSNPQFRWTAVDDTYVNTDGFPGVVLTRYRINGHDDSWSAWSSERALSFRPPRVGAYSISVQAIDAEGNLSDTVTGPEFLYGGISRPSNVAVSTRSP